MYWLDRGYHDALHVLMQADCFIYGPEAYCQKNGAATAES